MASRARFLLALPILVLASSAFADSPTAEELIPFEKLEVELREELWRVTQRYTLRRAADVQLVRARLSTYRWLIEHLDVASTAVRKLGLGKYEIEAREGGRFSIDDKDGAFASCERAFEEPGRQVLVARGHVEGVLLPRVKGTGVIVVRYRLETDDERDRRLERAREDGRTADDERRVLTDCRVFFRLEDGFLHLASQPFRRTLGKLLGDKLDGVVVCAGKISEIVDRDPQKVWDAIKDEKLPASVLEEFKNRFLVH